MPFWDKLTSRWCTRCGKPHRLDKANFDCLGNPICPETGTRLRENPHHRKPKIIDWKGIS